MSRPDQGLFWTNHHSHTRYCDGSEGPLAYVRAAEAAGMRAYGFSSHAPIPGRAVAWAMQPDRLRDYVAEIRGLAQDHTDSIELPLSLEVDYIPGVMGPHSAHVRSCGLDYVIGSVHFVDVLPDGTGWEIDGSSTVFRHGLEHLFGGDIRAAVSRYFAITRQMLAEDRPDVVGHIDKIKMQNTDFGLFDPAARWYRDELAQTLEAVAGSGCIMEVNTRGLYRGRTAFPYPGPWALRMARRLHVPVHLSSDAHRPDEITAEFGTAARMLMAAGYTECRIFLHGRWQDVQITHNGYMQ